MSGYFSPSFPQIDALSLQSIDRQVLVIADKYNQRAMNSDYIAVPRVVKLKSGVRIDVLDGNTVIAANYAARKKKGDYSLNDVLGYKRVFVAPGVPLRILDKKGNQQSVYKLVNLYGDGNRATENYTDFRPSVIDNGTLKTTRELNDADIVSYYGGAIQEEVVPLQKSNMVMQPDNVQKILSGEKTSTLRTESFPSGIYNFGGKDFQVTNRGLLNIQEAGGIDAISKSEAFAQTGPKYSSTKDFLEGKRKLYVYDISSVVPLQTEEAIITGDTITLKDGKEYNKSDVNSDMLEALGYTPNEIGKILKQIC